MFYRISFALDEKGKPIDSSSVSRPTVLHSKNTAAANNAKKQNGGPDRNNHVLMEFYLNKVSGSLLCNRYLSRNARRGEALRDKRRPRLARWTGSCSPFVKNAFLLYMYVDKYIKWQFFARYLSRSVFKDGPFYFWGVRQFFWEIIFSIFRLCNIFFFSFSLCKNCFFFGSSYMIFPPLLLLWRNFFLVL